MAARNGTSTRDGHRIRRSLNTMSALDAALELAGQGIYVGPLAKGTKNPGQLLGAGWHEKTTTEPATIKHWFKKTPDAGVFIHVGRSGLIVFDFDNDDLAEIPLDIADALRTGVFQRSSGTSDRGHYIFRTTERFGNGAGRFAPYGDVRGANGVIVTAPSIHPETGKPYRWVKAGGIPPLPEKLRSLLPAEGSNSNVQLSEQQFEDFTRDFADSSEPYKVERIAKEFRARVRNGESRHGSMLNCVGWAVREIRDGVFSANDAWETLEDAWDDAFSGGTDRVPNTTEFLGMWRWMAAQPIETLPDDLEHERRVNNELVAMRVRYAAKQQFAVELAGDIEVPQPFQLDEWLDEPDEEAVYRIEGLLPTGGKAALFAQYKAGKSTTVGNLARSLCDGVPFLGQYEVVQAQRVTLIDNELSEALNKRWLRDQGIKNADRLQVFPIRGRVSSFNIIDPTVRSQWAALLRGTDFLILDCLRPILDGLGLDENTQVGTFLSALEELLREAGIGECVLVHHMGHSGERARGDSRLLDWPDAIWNINRKNTTDPKSDRVFAAHGRDVDVSPQRLVFDPSTRHLSLETAPFDMSAQDATTLDVLQYLSDINKPVSERNIIDQLKSTHSDREVKASIKSAVGRRLIQRKEILSSNGAKVRRIDHSITDEGNLAIDIGVSRKPTAA